MKKLFFLVLLLNTIIWGQINLSISIRQPTPSSINVWQKDPSVLQLFAINSSTRIYNDAYFSFSIYDDNSNVIAYTDDQNTLLPRFTIPAGPPNGNGTLIINGPQLVRTGEIHFDNKMVNTVLSTNSLPEGDYQLCIKVFDSRGYNITNNEESCVSFSIRIPEPPTLISPLDGDTLLTDYQTFTWQPVTGGIITNGLKYKLRISPLFKGQNGRTAIESNPVLLERTISVPLYTYLPSDPSFSFFPDAVGYAWQVQALTSSGEPAARLDGKSEIRIFYKKKLKPIFSITPPILNKPENSVEIKTKTPTFSFSSIALAKNTYFRLIVVPVNMFQLPDDAIENNTPVYTKKYNSTPSMFLPTPTLNLQSDKDYAWQVQVIEKGTEKLLRASEVRTFKYKHYGPAMANVNGKLFYEFSDVGEYKGYPFANANIKLVKKYVLRYNVHHNNTNQGDQTASGELILPDNSAVGFGFSDSGTPVAYSSTNPEGSFNFSFMAFDSCNVLVKKDLYYVPNSAGGFRDEYIGDVYSEYRIILDNQFLQYYLNPTQNIVVQPDETVDVGNVFSYVRSYELTVTVKPTGLMGQQFTHEPIPNMIVYLMRKTRPALVPKNEGKPNPETPEMKFGMEVVAKATTGGWGDTKGKVTFHRLVRNAGIDDKYYYWAESDPDAGKENYKLQSIGYYSYKFHDDDAFYNNEYNYPRIESTIYAIPKLPEVAGKVLRGDSGQPLSGAFVQLKYFSIKNNYWWNEEKHWYTYIDGAFKFKDLIPEYNNQYKIAGPKRKLRITKYGFVSREIPVEGAGLSNALTMGEKWHDYAITMEPNSSIVGNVVNSVGLGVKSKVTVVGGESVDAVPLFDWSSFTYGAARFNLRAPSGNQKVIVDPTPYNPQYFKDTLSVNVSDNPTNVGNIVLTRKSHKLIISAYQVSFQGGFILPGSEKKIPNAHVILTTTDGTLIEDTHANLRGDALFDFVNSSDEFIITVKSPSEDLDLETRIVSMVVPESKNYVRKKVYLRKAAKVSGYVYVGKGNEPVNNAHVFLAASQSNGDAIEAYTKADGSFVLHNVPLGNYQTFTAAKSQSNTIGAHITLNIKEEGKSGVIFRLKVYNDMDITHLLGFPIEVTSLTETNSKVKISGNFVKLDSLKNPLFSSVTTEIGFSNVEIKPGKRTRNIFGKSVPISVPRSLPVKTSVNNISLKVYDKFNAAMEDKNLGVELFESGSEVGAFSGKVFVGEGNFSLSGETFNLEDDGFYLISPSGDLKLRAITASMNAPFSAPKGIPVCGKDKKGIKYKLYSYKADADKNGSYLIKDTLILKTNIHTALANIDPADINMDVGRVKILRDKIIPISSDKKKIVMNLDQWKIEGTKWTLKGYLTIHDGTLRTNMVDIPIEELNIEPDKISGGKFDLKQMSLPGGVPLNVTGNPVFNYNSAENYWFLFVGKGNADYSSYLSGLPGMVNNDKILIDAISLNSKGGKAFSPVYGQSDIKVYKVGYLSANSIEAFSDYTEITGLRFHIPGFSQAMRIRYGKDKTGNLVLRIVPLGISLQAKGVQMDFGFNQQDAETQNLDDFGFVARGRVYEQGKFTLNSWLYHTADSTSIRVETKPKQTLPIGGNSTYLANVTGFMKVANNQWSNFSFSGDMTGTKGVTDDKKRLSFVVKGEISASGQELGIKNIDAPFGDMSWTYEFENSRLIGTLTFHKDFSGVHIDGQAESLVDPDGWYLIAGGKMKLPGLGPGQAAILIGDYPRMTESVKDIFAASSYKKGLPASFETQISGFLFSGAIAIPVIIPDIDLDLVILYAKFGIHAGGDARLWMNFNNGGNEYGIGLMAFVHAFVTASSITCTEVSADATAELGAEGSYQTSSGVFSVDGCGSLKLGVHVIQKTPTPVGCKGTIFDEGFSFGIRTLMHLDSDGNTGLDFGLGTCSGQ